MENRFDDRVKAIALSGRIQHAIRYWRISINVSTLLLLVVVKRKLLVRNFSVCDSTEMKVMVVTMERDIKMLAVHYTAGDNRNGHGARDHDGEVKMVAVMLENVLVVQWKHSPSPSGWRCMIQGKLMMETAVERIVVRVRW